MWVRGNGEERGLKILSCLQEGSVRGRRGSGDG